MEQVAVSSWLPIPYILCKKMSGSITELHIITIAPYRAYVH